MPVVLTIAGFDPSSGAGITADLKVFAAHGVYGVAAITALTVQSTQGVLGLETVPVSLLGETLEALRADVTLRGVKIGMLATAEVVREVAGFLRRTAVPRSRVVLDPVLRSSSGADLLDAAGVDALREELLACVGWLTPNMAELGVLTEIEGMTRDAIAGEARRLAAKAAEAGNLELHVVVTGGEMQRPDDFLRTADGQERWFPGERVRTNATHGTGCAFSSALLCRVVLGDAPGQAVAAAKSYVREAMLAAFPVGKGKGPMHHLFRRG